MKKILCAITLIFVITIFSGSAVQAYGENSCRVIDEYGLLTQQQEETLNEALRELYDTYGADGVILIVDEVSGDERHAAARFMQEYNIGGVDHNAMCLLHQAEARNVAVVFRGELQYAFDEKIQDLMLDTCVDELKEDRYFEAYSAILEDYESGLRRVASGKSVRPMDMQGKGGFASFVLLAFVGSFIVAAVPVLLMTLYQRSRMKTNVPQPNADFYSEPDGLELDVSRDIYIRTATTRRHIPKDNDSHMGGGSSGSFSVGGESFSGSSRSY